VRAKSELDSQQETAWQEGAISARARTSHCFGPSHGVTVGGETGFQIATTKPALEHCPYLAEGRAHRESTYSLFATSTAQRETQLAEATKSPAQFIDIPVYRAAAWSPSTYEAQVVEQKPSGPPRDGTPVYSTWKCPGKLDGMCFNYYDEDSGSGILDGTQRNADAPGSDLSVFKINYNRRNRTNLLPPGSKARKDSKKKFNC
jgi:hypothetical protein